ncbi:hypothetical protein [Spiroplasma endosymbiont of Dasysyrphus albostriatus]|uniref:hypothetical protein n=1 Tax=Spiroplasma endosymbiont of Dasysyrphus albostriatus TaxID=3066299 RepID=UPI0030D4D28A
MLWWEILLIIISLLITSITILIFLIFIIIDLKNDYKIFKSLNVIAKDLEKKDKNKENK